MSDRDPFGSLSPPTRAALVERLGDLRHDLGKYVSMQLRWSADDPASLREALLADLLATRRGASGVADAAEVWEGYAPELRGERALSTGDRVDLRGCAEFDRLAAEMDEIRRAIGALRSDGALDLGRAAEAARAVTETCRALWQRARE